MRRPRSTLKKVTVAERDRRVTEVFTMILRGASRDDILRHASSEGWDVCDRAVDAYVRRARDRFAAMAQTTRDEELAQARARLDDLYQRAFRTQDYKLAASVQADRQKLLGLYAPVTQKTEHSGPGGGPVQIERILDAHELRARLARELVGGEEAPGLLAPPAPSPRGD